jgi:cell division septation protein DedD
VSAQNSEQEAQAAFRSMQAKYPNQLGGQQPVVRRKDLASGVKYGAQVGPYGSREEAARLCESIKAAGGPCFVERH